MSAELWDTIKKLIYWGFYAAWVYTGFKITTSNDPDIAWIIKLVGFFAWWGLPYWISKQKT